MRDLRPLLGLALLLAGCMSAVPSSSDSTPDLGCRLESRPPLVAGGPAKLHFELTNRSQAPVWVLRWNTPLEGWRGTILRITRDGRDGEEIPFQGPMFKRGDPAHGDYAEIAAGGRSEATVDLAEVYDLSRPGRDRVEVVGDLVDVTPDGGSVPRPRDLHHPVSLRCEAVDLEIAAGAP
jgi:hypothetical protein